MLRTIRRAPLALVIVVASFLCPTELSLDVAGLRLPPHRIALLLVAPFAVYRIISRPDTRIRLFDILFFTYAFWVLWVYHQHGPDNGSFVYGGSIALESFGGYVVARAYVRSYDDFRQRWTCCFSQSWRHWFSRCLKQFWASTSLMISCKNSLAMSIHAGWKPGWV